MSDRARRTLLLLAVATALADSSVVTLALPDILRRFDVEIGEVSRVLTSYNAILALGAVPAAYLARRAPRPVAAGGIVVFGVASAVCGLAGSFDVLLAARCIQAVGGAALVTAALELLAARDGDAKAARSWAAAGVAGAAVGPAAGGALTQLAGWEWIFLLQAPIALGALLALRQTTAPAPKAAAGRPHLPALAALTLLSAALTAALFLLVLLLVEGWRIEPLEAAVIVSAMPVAAFAAPRIGVRGTVAEAATGSLLVGGRPRGPRAAARRVLGVDAAAADPDRPRARPGRHGAHPRRSGRALAAGHPRRLDDRRPAPRRRAGADPAGARIPDRPRA